MSDQEKDLLNQEAFSEEELDNLVELTDEDGNPATFEFLDVIEYQGKEYVALLPTEEEETAEVVILEIQPIEDSEDEDSEDIKLMHEANSASSEDDYNSDSEA